MTLKEGSVFTIVVHYYWMRLRRLRCPWRVSANQEVLTSDEGDVGADTRVVTTSRACILGQTTRSASDRSSTVAPKSTARRYFGRLPI